MISLGISESLRPLNLKPYSACPWCRFLVPFPRGSLGSGSTHPHSISKTTGSLTVACVSQDPCKGISTQGRWDGSLTHHISISFILYYRPPGRPFSFESGPLKVKLAPSCPKPPSTPPIGSPPRNPPAAPACSRHQKAHEFSVRRVNP